MGIILQVISLGMRPGNEAACTSSDIKCPHVFKHILSLFRCGAEPRVEKYTSSMPGHMPRERGYVSPLAEGKGYVGPLALFVYSGINCC